MKKFGGFTESQMEAVARRMGFNGPMHKFNEFLSTSPGKATQLQRYSELARSMVEDGQPMAKGGAVKKQDPKPKPKPVPKTAGTSASISTKQMIENPQKITTEATPIGIKPKAEDFIKDKGNIQKSVAQVKERGVEPGTSIASVAPKTEANTYESEDQAKRVAHVVNKTKTVEGELSAGAKMQAATALPSANATVQGQLEGLMSQFEGGNAPPWAAGAMRMAQTVMAQRGLGASSMAGSAITQAAMESAISIAVQDAQTYSAFEMQNLNNRQQARLQNAQSFLQMDLANLDVANQTNLFKAQARIQSFFTDQAADNAAKQFNATSQNQTDQFFAQLKTQVAQFNAGQRNAMKTANADRSTSIRMFNSEQRNARDQFNATQRLIIDQSNAQWRRNISTQNNANINESNRLNAQLLTGMTMQGYNNLWQTERDLMQYAFTSAENANQRAHEVVLQKMVGKNAEDFAKGQAGGNLAGEIFSGIANRAADEIFENWF